MTPKTRFALAVIAFPVPLSFVGNNSGESAYKTPYITLLVKLYPQFQPRRALEVRAVVEAMMKAPVSTGKMLAVAWNESRSILHVEIHNVPRLPRYGSSTIHPASRAPGTPITEMMTCYRHKRIRIIYYQATW